MIISQELKAAEDPEFETFYTKNILLNEGNTTLEWLSKIKLMKIISSQKRYCQEVILCDRTKFKGPVKNKSCYHPLTFNPVGLNRPRREPVKEKMLQFWPKPCRKIKPEIG